MKVMSVNNSNSNYKKQQSFQALNLDSAPRLRNAGENVVEGVKLALTPKEGDAKSIIGAIAQYNDVSIGAYSKNSPENGKLWLKVSSDGQDRYNDSFETVGKTAKEIGDALTKAIKALFDDASKRRSF